jgi:hypothetical protein
MAGKIVLKDAVQGARHVVQAYTWPGNLSLTGATLTGTKREKNKTAVTAIDGTLTADADQATNPGKFTWDYGAGDVGTAGIFFVQIRATFADFDAIVESRWEVHALQSATAVAAEGVVGVLQSEADYLEDLVDGTAVATDGQVWTADGAGGAAFEDATGGGGASDVGDLTTDGLTPGGFLRIDNPSGLIEISAFELAKILDGDILITDLAVSGMDSGSYWREAVGGFVQPRTPEQVLSDIGAAATAHTHSYLANIVEDTTPQLGGNLDAQSFNVQDVDMLSFDTTPDNTPTNEGEMGWNSDFHTIDIKPGFTGVTIQTNQESVILVYNNSGAQIDDGSAVYISGKEDALNVLTIALARADAANTSKMIGVTTHDIGNGAFGLVSQFGYINGLDTSTFADGAPIWLSDTVAGGFTDVEPQSPSFSVFVGTVVDSHASTGNIFLTTIGNTSGTTIAGDATQVVLPARKDSAGTINKGQVVYVVSYNSGQNVAGVELADSDSGSTMPAIGIASDSITNSATGNVTLSGRVAGFNTSSFSVGDELYVSGTAGELTATKPTGTALIQKVAIVLRSHASQGAVWVVGAGRSNDLPNLAQDNIWVGDASGVPTAVSGATARTAIGAAAASDLSTHEGLSVTAHSGLLPQDTLILSKSATYEVAAGDAGKTIECSGTFTVTFPNGLDTGFQVTIVNIGAGVITLSAATTLTSAGTQIATQYTGAVVYHAGSNVWRAMGRLT